MRTIPMAQVYSRCPRCHTTWADVWRITKKPNERVLHLICRLCAFDWAITELSEEAGERASPYPTAVTRSEKSNEP